MGAIGRGAFNFFSISLHLCAGSRWPTALTLRVTPALNPGKKEGGELVARGQCRGTLWERKWAREAGGAAWSWGRGGRWRERLMQVDTPQNLESTCWTTCFAHCDWNDVTALRCFFLVFLLRVEYWRHEWHIYSILCYFTLLSVTSFIVLISALLPILSFSAQRCWKKQEQRATALRGSKLQSGSVSNLSQQ